MKILKRLLIIKWHYIEHEMIELENINFLTGKNASGKSTIIDALQLLMLGDTTGYFFNKAANDSSTRTLKGYLRGEITDDGGSGFLYLRNGTFSSYIAAEFYDDIKKKYITCGVVFDSFDDGNHEHKFFISDFPIPKNEFIINDTPMDIKSLRLYLNSNYKGKFSFFDSNKSYQSNLLGKLGGINTKYFSLFKKSVPFSPIMDIEKFISEFVCDVPNRIDITDMQDNIRYYKQLESEASMVKDRISKLQDIDLKYKSYSDEENRLLEQSYLMDRAKQKKLQNTIYELQERLNNSSAEIDELSLKIEDREKELERLEEKKDKLLEEKYNSREYKLSEELKRKKDSLSKEIEKVQGILSSLETKLKNIGTRWFENILMFYNKVSDYGEEVKSEAEWLKAFAADLKAVTKEGLIEISQDKLKMAKENMDIYKNYLQGLYYNKINELETLKARLKRLSTEVEGLKKGIKPYDRKLLEMKREIEDALFKKYGHKIPVNLLCELIEIKDRKWQDAIEGYLHTQKFYMIVEPRYFMDALKVYDELKFKRNFYDFGLVDSEKLIKLNPYMEKGSLAQEVYTSNPYARAFINFILGRVMKCENIENLRNYKTSITPSCMLYQNFVARQLNPDRWQVPYIGKASIERQIELKENELKELNTAESNLKIYTELLDKLRSIEPLTSGEIDGIVAQAEEGSSLDGLLKELKSVTNEYGSIDLTNILSIDEKIKETDENRKKLNSNIISLRDKRTRIDNELNRIKNDTLPSLSNDERSLSEDIKLRYDSQWVLKIGESRFERELESRKSPDNIITAFNSQIMRTKSQRDKKWEELVHTRAEYIRDYKMSYDVNFKSNKPFDDELKDLVNTKLSLYEEKIKSAKEKAQSQFKEDFISKLKYNIDTVTEQIDELNAALKDVSFGRDKYCFDVKPNPSYRKYYDMITDNMLLEGFNLFSMEFQSKHMDAIEELFKNIVDIREGNLTGDERAELEKNIEKYTDYRTYLNFELISTDQEGRESRLSKTISKKSGGETQTPFYIAVLASFVRIYRVKQRRDNNTLRLIVFDEAFSKMDHQRIAESIKLLRTMGLQAIISAPTEKIGDIAPLVDRNLCVTRVKDRTIVRAFDPKEIMEDGL